MTERILLHLLPYGRVTESLRAPDAVTQDGISEGVGIRRSHVPRSLSRLMREGLVEETLAHVQRGTRRRKAYFLTSSGLRKAEELKAKILREKVRYVTREGQPNMGTFEEAMRVLSLGFGESLSQWLAQGVIAPKETTPPHPPKDAVFVDREKEIESLIEHIARSREGPRVVFLTGEPGIGKSELLARFATRVRDSGAVVLPMRCIYSEMFDPYMPIWDAVRTFCEEFPDFASVSRDLKKISMQEDDSQEMLFAQMLDVLLRLGENMPIIMTIDDIQNASGEFLKFIHYLSLRMKRCLIVCTYPIGIDSTSPVLEVKARMIREGVATEMALSPLAEEDSLGLIREVKPECSSEDALTLYSLSKGNPYFMLEMLGSGFPEREVMPDALREFVMRDIASLSKKTREIVEWAAVMGKEFDVQVLEALSDMPESEFYDRVEDLFTRRIFREFGGPARCGFNPPIIQEVIYGSISRPRAAALHRKVAQAIEEIHLETLEEHIFDLARHYRSAGDVERTLRYAEMCAERCEETLAYTTAIEYFRMCLDILTPQKDRYAADIERLRGDLAEAYYLAGDYRRSLEILEELAGSSEEQWDVRRKIAGVHMRQGDAERALAMYEELMVEEDIPQDALARVHADAANAYLKKGDPARALEHAGKAHAIVKRTGDVLERAHVLMLLAMAHWGCGMCETAAGFMEECMQIREGYSDPMELAHTYNLMGMLLADMRRFEDALIHLKKALKIKESSPDVHGRIAVKNNIALVLNLAGTTGEAMEMFQEILGDAENLGDPTLIFGAVSNLGGIALSAGRMDEAFECFRRAHDIAHRIDSIPDAISNAAYNLACAYRSVRDLENAVRWMREAESSARSVVQRARYTLLRCELMMEAGDRCDQEEVEAAFKVCETSGDLQCIGWGHRVLSVALRSGGDLGASEEHALESISIAKETSKEVDLGLACLEYARTLRTMGREKDALRQAIQAVEAFTRAGEEALLSRVREEFPDVDGRECEDEAG